MTADDVQLDERLARHLHSTRFENLPSSVVATTKLALLDLLGVQLAATTLGEGCAGFAEIAREMGGAPQSTVLMGGFKASAPLAAQDKAFREKLEGDFIEPTAGSPEQAAAFMRAEVARWQTIGKAQ